VDVLSPGLGHETAYDGLYRMEGEFFTEHFIIRGELTTPERRLSDHLNGSTATFQLNLTSVLRSVSGLRVNVAGSLAYVSKSHLLFVLPREDADPDDRTQREGWTATIDQTCWIGLGRYSLLGRVHMDAKRDPRFFMRSLEQRQFVPLTSARLTYPDGTMREYPVVLVNRFHMELLAVQPPTGGARSQH